MHIYTPPWRAERAAEVLHLGEALLPENGDVLLEIIIIIIIIMMMIIIISSSIYVIIVIVIGRGSMFISTSKQTNIEIAKEARELAKRCLASPSRQ